MLQRIKRAYKAFLSPSIEDVVDDGTEIRTFQKMFRNGKDITHLYEQGDGNAVFLGEGTTEEYEQQLKEDKGEDKWYKRILNL